MATTINRGATVLKQKLDDDSFPKQVLTGRKRGSAARGVWHEHDERCNPMPGLKIVFIFPVGKKNLSNNDKIQREASTTVSIISQN